MRYLIPAFAALALLGTPIASHAQVTTVAPTVSDPAVPPTHAPAAPKGNKLAKRFASANTTHDGHLTLEQAKAAKWTQVVRHYGKLDASKKGYVTEDEIRTAAAGARAAKAKPAANKT
jgi:mRNA-degrading endonuclease toxin of MazEF toxin-antitoxin module